MRKKKILLRFDDICPTMNWEQWGKAKALLDENGVQALLGVIPDCKDPDLMIDEPREDFWEFIRELQNNGYTIAMHGLNHVFDSCTRGLVNKTAKSEFAGHSYDVQFQKIKKGKEILSRYGINTDVFFAPAHSYDENTLRALAANGFKYISDGKGYKPYFWHDIKCIPARSGGVPALRGNLRYYTAIFHVHEWVREEKKKNKEWFEKIFLNKDARIVSFDQLRDWRAGAFYMIKLDEILYIYWSYYIRPMLIRVAKTLLSAKI